MPVMSITLLILSVVFLVMGVSVAASLGLASIIVMLVYHPVPNMMIIPQLFSESSTSFILLAVPLFILAGNLMERGSMGRNLIEFTSSFVGWMKGGLGSTTIIGSMIFGGISGSSLADTATFGTILVPRMVADKYPKDYAAAITLCSSCLAVIIPPSILIVLAAASTLQSVGRALAAGVLPGVMITVLLLIPNYLISKKHGYGTKIPFSIRNIGKKFFTCWTALIAPLIILGSIFSGIVTPTEGALVAVLYIVFVDMLIFRKFNVKDFTIALKNTSVLSASILFIATSSSIANWIIAYEHVPQVMSQALIHVPGGQAGFIIMIIIMLIIIGMTLDAAPAILIFTPLFLPVAISLGMDPTHFLMLMVVGFAIGLTTPPYGVCLFSISAICKIPMDQLVRASWPFYVILFIALLIVAFFPSLSLFLPDLLGI
jgi:tripartite ATP-independent transporter DctM subunit